MCHEKVKTSIDHINEVSKAFVKQLGQALFINEMMKLFKKQSSQAYVMKNKTIQERFKFWAD